ncbi:MAG: UvrB/UvrC motif-containing protein [Intestinimonas sp.]
MPRGCEIIRGPHVALPHGAMQEASKRLEFEYAAVLRDRIIELRGQ